MQANQLASSQRGEQCCSHSRTRTRTRRRLQGRLVVLRSASVRCRCIHRLQQIHQPPGDSNGGPRIAYPPADASIELGTSEAVPLKALGGAGRLRWLVDGQPIDGTRWVPDGPGSARLAGVANNKGIEVWVVHLLRAARDAPSRDLAALATETGGP